MASPISAGFPNLQTPFVSEVQLITIPWYQFLRALWLRSGGSSGAAFITEIDTGAGLSGGPANAANPNSIFSLAQIGDGMLLGNITGSSNPPTAITLTSLLDEVFGSGEGQIIFRDASTWTVLVPGTAGSFLQTGGPGADPSWVPGSTVAGGLLNVQTFLPAGSPYTYTPTAGTGAVLVKCQAGGGGGGGSMTVIAAHVSAGGSGGGGGYSEEYLTSAFSGVTVTVGAAGTAAAAGANVGGNGGNSSFGALLTATGGGGGVAGTDVSVFPVNTVSGAAGGATSASGNGLVIPGSDGMALLLGSSTGVIAASGGGTSQLSNATDYRKTTNAGFTANGYGGGGTGGFTIASTQQAGGAGSGGLVQVYEYS